MSTVLYKKIHFDGNDINEQWLEARRHGLGGSDMAAVLGVSPWKTPYDIWAEKTGRATPEDISDKPTVEWGTILEDEIANYFAKKHPEMKVTRVNAILQSKKHPWMLASLDRRLRDEYGNPGVLEIKTASVYSANHWQDGVPAWYKIQVAHYLAITGWSYAIVAVLIGGSDYREYVLTRKDLAKEIDAVIAGAEEFWKENVLSDRQPAMLGYESEAKTIMSMVSDTDDTKTIIDAPDSFDDLIDHYNLIKAELDDLKQKQTACANEIKALIGSNEGMESGRFKVTWTRGTRRTFDRKRFEEDHPNMTDDYYVISNVNGSLNIKEKM